MMKKIIGNCEMLTFRQYNHKIGNLLADFIPIKRPREVCRPNWGCVDTKNMLDHFRKKAKPTLESD
jgi:hypothetical protein